MDDFTEPPKPPLLLPEPEKSAVPAQDAPPAPEPLEDLAEVTEIEPREEVHVEEIEQLPRERRPQGGPRHDPQGRRDQRDHHGHFGSHRPRPFVTDSRPRGHNNHPKDVKREILVNSSPEETRVAVVENEQLI